MAWSFVGHRGSASNKTSGNSLMLNPSALIPKGAVLLAVAIADNTSTVSGSADHSVCDYRGNHWQKIGERTNAAAAGAGITLSLWQCRVSKPLDTTDGVNLMIRGSVTAKALSLYEYSVPSGFAFAVAGIASAEQDNTAAPTVTLNSLEAGKQHAFLGVVAREADSANTYTQDANYNDRTPFGTTGGTGATNVSAIVGDRLATITGDTFNPSLGAAADCITALLAMVEIESYSITVQNVINDGTNLGVTYSRNGDGGGHGISWPLDQLAENEITAGELEMFLLRSLLTVARRNNLTPAQMIGAEISAFPGASRTLMTLER